jgi:hypothetical protein
VKKVLALISIAALAGCAGLPAQTATPIGFRGAMLGAAPLAGMQPLEKWKAKLGGASREISDAYIRPGESHELGDLSIQGVTYEYFNNQLFRVEVDLWTDQQKRCPKARELVKALESQFGISMTRHQEDFIKPIFLSQWRSTDAWVTYMCLPENSTNSIVIESPMLRSEVDAQLKETRKANDGRATEKIRNGLK